MNQNSEYDNAELVEKCINGEPDALNLFYSRYARKMYGVILRYIPDPNDAEDILHDGFLVAYTRLNTIRNPESLDYWLATIMKNLSLQFLQEQDVVSIMHDIPEVEDSPDFEDIIDFSVLESLIRKLPKGYQTVFRLSVLENKTHKEISQILGIAPNSSSSQLFHAKIMMRKLVAEYRRSAELLTLLLILIGSGIAWLLTYKDNNTDLRSQQTGSLSQIANQVKTSRTSNHNNINSVQNPNPSVLKPLTINPHTAPAQIAVNASSEVDTLSGSEKIIIPLSSETTAKDSISNLTVNSNEDRTTAESYASDFNAYAFNYDDLEPDISKSHDWSFKIGASLSLGADNILRVPGYMDALPSDKLNNGNEDDNDEKKKMSKRSHNYHYHSHHNDLPISIAASFNKSFSKIIGLETGLIYTYLHTTLEYKNLQSDCRWHYLGIPIKLTLNNFKNKHLCVYASAGAQLDIPLYSCASSSKSAPDFFPHGRFHSSAVWSVFASYGISYNVSKHVGLYIEPSLHYHFKHDYEVPNLWTDNNWGFSIPIGLRFNF